MNIQAEKLSIEMIFYRLKDLRPGDGIVYYQGNLGNLTPSIGNHLTARLAWDLYEEGRVHLVQRRIGRPINYLGTVDWHGGLGPGFDYIAIGRSSRKNKVPNFNAHLRTVMEPI